MSSKQPQNRHRVCAKSYRCSEISKRSKIPPSVTPKFIATFLGNRRIVLVGIMAACFEKMYEPESYNRFFHPHVCHVCKSRKQTKLKLCANCQMISYCGKEHMLLHLGEHRQICEAIVKLNRIRNIWNTEKITSDEWLAFRNRNIESVANVLQRDLELYEKQMFWFAKSCFVCHRQMRMLSTCKSCLSVDCCLEHNFHYFAHDCLYLSQAFVQNINDMTSRSQDNRISKLYLKFSSEVSMESHIEQTAITERKIKQWHRKDYVTSDYLSAPMTLYLPIYFSPSLYFSYLMESTFVIHVIAGTSTEKCALSAWEVMSHYMKENQLIVVIMIESGLQENIIQWRNCGYCCQTGRDIRFEFHTMLYHDYVQSCRYTRPNMIVGYHLEFKRFVMETIRAIKYQQCPLLMTTKSAKKAEDNIAIIQNELKEDVKPFLKIENNFMGKRPYRDHEEENVYFRNYYVIVYENLNDIGYSTSE